MEYFKRSLPVYTGPFDQRHFDGVLLQRRRHSDHAGQQRTEDLGQYRPHTRRQWGRIVGYMHIGGFDARIAGPSHNRSKSVMP